MYHIVPALVIKAGPVDSAILLNGVLQGEAGMEEGIGIPVADDGEYFITLLPLYPGDGTYYPTTRKLVFEGGKPIPPIPGDVTIYAWPGGVYEVVMRHGEIPKEQEAIFPYTLASMEVSGPKDRVATLYWEGGLYLAVEDKERIRYGTLLGYGEQGALYEHNGLLIAHGGANMAQEQPEEVLLALNGDCQEVLRVHGKAVNWFDGEAQVIRSMGTSQGHEGRTTYRFQGNAFQKGLEDYGFFTHTPKRPTQAEAVAFAFVEAVQLKRYPEAFSYMTPSLQQDLGEEALEDFFGQLIGCRKPVVAESGVLGLVYPDQAGLHPVRLFVFEVLEGLVDNVKEG